MWFRRFLRCSTFLRVWLFKKCLMVIFSVLHENLIKIRIAPPYPTFKCGLFWTSWPRMTWTWHDATKSPGGCLEVSQTRFRLFRRLYFSLVQQLCPARPTMTDGKKSDLWPDLWCHQWPADKIRNIFGKLMPGASYAVFGSRICQKFGR